jgi:hypothetical protein
VVAKFERNPGMNVPVLENISCYGIACSVMSVGVLSVAWSGS